MDFFRNLVSFVSATAIIFPISNCFQLSITDFFTECPCLQGFGNATQKVKAPSTEACYVTCMATKGCVLFSYCNITKLCEVWHSDKTEIGWSDVFNHQCLSREPSTSSRKWYVAGATPNITTVTCKEIKEQNPSASDGYYKIKVRGIVTEAYCVMSEIGDGLTFIDVQDAYTEFNHGPNDPATMRYNFLLMIGDFIRQTLHYSGQPHDYITIRNGMLLDI
ncbi:uncharacterized protein LOC142342045 [Convolutriloba macropyga]|uniref:uncharacterized protein LOC142342045 n=1 Tax=Convolutriloba macropyga TaxID=536237 RepID=UPI003F51D57F